MQKQLLTTWAFATMQLYRDSREFLVEKQQMTKKQTDSLLTVQIRTLLSRCFEVRKPGDVFFLRLVVALLQQVDSLLKKYSADHFTRSVFKELPHC